MATNDKHRSYTVQVLSPERTEEALDVLCDSFYDYPVMRHVVGDVGDDYDGKLRTLIGFFLAARVLREEPMLAVIDEGRVVAVAILTTPGDKEAPPALAERREIVWGELGNAARERYEKLGQIWQQFTIPESHYHLNMIGVSRSHAGSGLGRLLLDAVHDLSRNAPDSSGVSLTTEDPANVSLYEYFGYEVVGNARFSPEYETWAFFRRDS
ncbi:MAG: GNAT family N-acetyltransferase [Gemmatimonadota bacterium]|nr:MAG: GNAT family N-acetyltransferase [Gemmatimonadota bacterium]